MEGWPVLTGRGTGGARRARLSATIGLALGASLLGAVNAQAQVIEIAETGSVVVHGGPAQFSESGVVAIAPLPTERSNAETSVDPRPPSYVVLRSQVRAPGAVGDALAAASLFYGLDPALLDAVAWQESRYDQQAISPKGAIGVMQLMPGTAGDLGVDPRDLRQNVFGGAAYLRFLIDRYGDVRIALAAYNAGPGAVERHDGIPPFRETQTYVVRVVADASNTRSPRE
jgi:soluble lytic murein transglycosylase-like protein